MIYFNRQPWSWYASNKALPTWKFVVVWLISMCCYTKWGLIAFQQYVTVNVTEIYGIAKHSIQAFMHFRMKPQVIFMSCKVYLDAKFFLCIILFKSYLT